VWLYSLLWHHYLRLCIVSLVIVIALSPLQCSDAIGWEAGIRTQGTKVRRYNWHSAGRSEVTLSKLLYLMDSCWSSVIIITWVQPDTTHFLNDPTQQQTYRSGRRWHGSKPTQPTFLTTRPTTSIQVTLNSSFTTHQLNWAEPNSSYSEHMYSNRERKCAKNYNK